MHRLEGLDTAFVYLDLPAAPMHVAMTCVFDPHTVQGGYSFATVRRRVRERLHLVPPFRRRLVSMPGHVHRPVWIDDPDFDLDRHVHRATLPSPGGAAELERFTAEVISRPLDRSRPLWEMHVVDGLEAGMVAIVTKMHHATIDGVSAAELAANLLDVDPDAGPVAAPASAWSPERIPSRLSLMRDAGRELIGQPIAAASTMASAAAAALRLRRHNRKPDTIPVPGPFDAPRTCCNRPLAARRQVGFAEVGLDDVKRIKNATGTTVNDVVLALCSGALRDHLSDHDALPERSLVAAVPVSVRADDERAPGTNRLSAMLVDLATTNNDPLARLAAIATGARAAKDQHHELGNDTLSRLAELTPPAILAGIGALESRLNMLSRAPLCNVIVSNFPGPPFPLYLAGARMLAAYPLGPLGVGTGLNITVQSYLNTLWFGVVACPETIPAPEDIPERLTNALHDLNKACR
jgi:WS/DGAT/MGAT family acyltransferase